MTKPHEEEWKTGEGALSGALYSGDTWIGSFTDPKRARLAVQAQRMVQVLMGLIDSCTACDKTGVVYPYLGDGCFGQKQACHECGASREILKACGAML